MPPSRSRRRSAPFVVTLLLALALTGGSADGAGAASASTGCARPLLGAGDHVLHVTVDGAVRSALVHVPARALGHPAPLLLTFHGAGGTGPGMAASSGLLRVADRAGFIAVFPTATAPRRVWSAYTRSTPPDVAFVTALLDRLQATACVDLRRVSAAGLSVGGGFAARLACDLSRRLAGVVVVAGALAGLGTCPTGNPVSILDIHGTADPVAHYWGRNGVGGVLAWLSRWLARDDCGPTVHTSVAARGVQRLTWAPCRGGSVVQHLIISGGRHQWPGASPPDPGPTSGVSAARAAWQFLAPRRLSISPPVR